MQSLEALLQALDEKNTWLFERLWSTFTPDELTALLDQTLAVQAAGGERTVDGRRARTSGGIFVRLLQRDFPERSAPIFAEQNQQRRKEKLANMKATLEKMDKDVLCPPELLGQLIGKSGQSINALREKAPGCKITVQEESGRVRIDGEPEAAAAARVLVQEHVTALILHTHREYAEQVLMSDFMVSGHKDELEEPWAKTLYSWVVTCVEQTSAKQFSTTLIRLAASTPTEVRLEIATQLSDDPTLLGEHQQVVTTILAAVAAADEPSKSALGEGSTAATDTAVDTSDAWEEVEPSDAVLA